MTSSNQSVSAERGALKVSGVLFIVLGVVYLISGGVMIAGARVVDTTQTVAVADGLDLNVMVWSLALAVWWLISGLFYIVFGALGIRGAKNPAKIGVFMVLAWILAIVGMISVVLSQLLGVSVNWLGWIVFAVTIAAAIYATKIRKDARNACAPYAGPVRPHIAPDGGPVSHTIRRHLPNDGRGLRRYMWMSAS